jgi:hypothetical protein
VLPQRQFIIRNLSVPTVFCIVGRWPKPFIEGCTDAVEFRGAADSILAYPHELAILLVRDSFTAFLYHPCLDSVGQKRSFASELSHGQHGIVASMAC